MCQIGRQEEITFRNETTIASRLYQPISYASNHEAAKGKGKGKEEKTRKTTEIMKRTKVSLISARIAVGTSVATVVSSGTSGSTQVQACHGRHHVGIEADKRSSSSCCRGEPSRGVEGGAVCTRCYGSGRVGIAARGNRVSSPERGIAGSMVESRGCGVRGRWKPSAHVHRAPVAGGAGVITVVHSVVQELLSPLLHLVGVLHRETRQLV